MNQYRRTIRRLGIVLSAAALCYWLVTLFIFNATYFGDVVTIAAGDGYFAVYWGADDAEFRNTRVLNNFSWPQLPGKGGGLGWNAEDWRWSTAGPDLLLSKYMLDHRLAYPRNFGLWLPGADVNDRPAYAGLPAWVPLVLGLLCIVLTFTRRPPGAGSCTACGYDLIGLTPDAMCPECGTRSATVPAGYSHSLGILP